LQKGTRFLLKDNTFDQKFLYNHLISESELEMVHTKLR
jgi:hypothetical protein